MLPSYWEKLLQTRQYCCFYPVDRVVEEKNQWINPYAYRTVLYRTAVMTSQKRVTSYSK